MWLELCKLCDYVCWLVIPLLTCLPGYKYLPGNKSFVTNYMPKTDPFYEWKQDYVSLSKPFICL